MVAAMTEKKISEVDKPSANKKSFSLYPLAIAILLGLWAGSYLSPQNNVVETIKYNAKVYQYKFLEYWNNEFVQPQICAPTGVQVEGGVCICDVGYTGPTCATKILEGPVSTPKQVLLVVENFGVLSPTNEDQGYSYLSLANTLVQREYSVSVLYIGQEPVGFSAIANRYAGIGINLLKLNPSGLSFGENPIVQRSYEVMLYLRTRTSQYSQVLFTASSGAGYHTLVAKHQELTCFPTNFIVSLDTISGSFYEKLQSNDPEYLSTKIDTLKLDYMQQKSIELSDNVVVVSSKILETASSLGWNFPEATRVIHPIPTMNFEDNDKQSNVDVSSSEKATKEFVFLGTFDVIGGLSTFCDALDLLSKFLVQHNIQITFWGSNRMINDMTSEEYIELRSVNWKFQWNLRSRPNLKEVVSYMAEPSSGRVAVMPALFEGFPYLLQELLFQKLPVIGSFESGAVDIVSQKDASTVLTKPTSRNLAKILKLTITDGAVIPISNVEQTAAASQWISLYDGLESNPSTCFKTTGVNNLDKASLPLVTVVLVHRNRPQLVQQAIQSLEAQTYANFEVILVDDGSDDPEAIQFLNELAWSWWEDKGWKVLREPNRYLGAARNTGAKHAMGEYVLFMDDDDYAKPHQIETMVRVAESTSADVITNGHDIFDGLNIPAESTGSRLRFTPIGGAKLAGMLENIFGDANMMVRKSFFVDIGGFTEEYGIGFEDYEFLAKIVLKGHHLEAISDSLHWYRKHSNTMTTQTNLKSNQARFLRVYLAEHPFATKHQQELLKYTRRLFFEHGSSLSERDINAFDQALLNTTITASMTMSMTMTMTLSATTTVATTTPTTPTTLTTSTTPTTPTTTVSSATSIPTGGCSLDLCYTPCGPVTSDYIASLSSSDYSFTTTTCLDCTFTPFGTAIVDACGVCQGDYSTCFVVTEVSPRFAQNNGNWQIRLDGAGFLTKGPFTVTVNGTNYNNILYDLTTNSVAYIQVSDVFALDPNESDTTTLFVVITTDSYQSSTFEITVYSNATTLDSIVTIPSKIYMYDNPPIVNLFFTQLYDFDEALCLYQSDDLAEAIVTPFHYINVNAGWCDGPDSNDDVFNGVISTKFTVDLQFSYVNKVNPDPNPNYVIHKASNFTITYWAHAPNITEIIFDDSGSFIYVFFDSVVGTLGANDGSFNDDSIEVPCGTYFDWNTTDTQLASSEFDPEDCVSAFPDPSFAYLSISASFAFNIGARAPIPGMNLTLKSNTLGAYHALYTDMSSGTAQIQSPTNPPQPEVVIDAATILPNCSDAEIDLSSSVGGGGRLFTSANITFTASDNSSPLTDADLQTFLNNAAADIANGNLLFTIPASLIPAPTDRTYTFTVQLTNFLLATGSAVISITKMSTDDVPYIVLSGPTSISVNSLFQLSAAASPICNKTDAISVKWSTISGPGPNPIPTGADTVSTLAIPAYGMSLATYTFNAEVGYVTYSSRYNYTWTVTVTPGVLTVSIGGGRTVGFTNRIAFKASTMDTTYPPLSQPSVFSYVWSCIDISTSLPCVANGGSTLSIPSTQSPTIAGGSLLPGSYLFSVNVTNTATNGKATSPSAIVVVKGGSLPGVSLSLTESNPSAFSDSFAIVASVDTSTITSAVKNLVFTWGSLAICDKVSTSTVSIISSNLQSPMGGSTLKFKPGVLISGAKYCIAVSVVDPVYPSAIGYTYIAFSTKQRPSNGFCSLTSCATGVAFSTIFSIRCSGWSVDPSAAPAVYGFSAAPVVNGVIGTYSSLGPLSASSVWSSVLAEGDYVIQASVYDKFLASNAVPQLFNITVSANPDPNAAQEFLDNAAAGFSALGDTKAAMKAMSVSHSISGSSSSRRLIRRSDVNTCPGLLTLTAQLLNSGAIYLEPSSTGPTFLDTLNKIAGLTYTVDPSSLECLFNLLNIVVTSVSSNSAQQNTCFDSKSSAKIISTINVILGTVNATGSILPPTIAANLVNAISTLEKCLSRPITCGQNPVSLSSQFVSRTIGISNADSTQLFCGFTLPNLSNSLSGTSIADADGCVNFGCGTVSSSSFNATGGNAISSNIYDLTFRSSNGQVWVDQSLASPLVFTIPIPSNYWTQYNFSSYVVGGTNDPSTHSLVPSCSYYKYASTGSTDITAGQWDDTGCTVIGITSNSVTCSCTHLTEFGISLKSNIAPSVTTITSSGTNTPGNGTGSSSNSSATAGIIAGSVAAVFVVSVSLFIMIRKRQQIQKGIPNNTSRGGNGTGVVKSNTTIPEPKQQVQEILSGSMEKLKDFNGRPIIEMKQPHAELDMNHNEVQPNVITPSKSTSLPGATTTTIGLTGSAGATTATAAAAMVGSSSKYIVSDQPSSISIQEQSTTSIYVTGTETSIPPLPRVERESRKLPAYHFPPSYEDHLRRRAQLVGGVSAMSTMRSTISTRQEASLY